MKLDNIPVNENPIHIPSVPPTEQVIDIKSYIKYSSYSIVLEFREIPKAKVFF